MLSHFPDHVSPGYRHRTKRAEPRDALVAGDAIFKWYDLYEEGLPVTDDVRALARESVSPDGAEAGFVILHRCGDSFYFLLLSSWRGNNEVWQAVHYLDAGMTGFTSFAPAYADRGLPRPTFCVWEIGIVAHEARSWARFLASERTRADVERWRADVAVLGV